MDTKQFNKDQVITIINSVIARVEQGGDDTRTAIHRELLELRQVIDDLKAEIAKSGAGRIGDEHLPQAHDELDAVVEATEAATNTIMDACDVISNAAADSGPDASAKIMDQITLIYEACSFQDITGQRIKKVTKTLQEVDSKIAKVIALIAQTVPLDGSESIIERAKKSAPQSEANLMNGPQLPGAGVSQDEIDKLLESF